MSEKRGMSTGAVVVVYQPDMEPLLDLVRECFHVFGHLEHEFAVYVWDNSPTPVAINLSDEFNSNRLVLMGGDGNNLGFGEAVNRVIQGTRKDWYFVFNQDLRVDRAGLERAVREVSEADATVAVLEFAHRPLEHPKEYDPVTHETPWFSGAAFCVYKRAFLEAGGFDGRLFMYGEDVDLSFRLRRKGWVIRYLAGCAVFHDDWVGPHGQKPLQEVYDRANNILLRLKYGSGLVALRGILWLLAESVYFLLKGRRIPLIRILTLVFQKAMAFNAERLSPHHMFSRPRFQRWRYCGHRLGGQHAIERIDVLPKVSIIIRTMNRPRMLKEALQTAWRQTYQNIEVVVIDDGEGEGEHVIGAFPPTAGRELVYERTNGSGGRAAAGNLGLSRASGDFVCFLDDDDQLYADHVEILVGRAVTSACRVVYALAEEVAAKYIGGGEWSDGDVTIRYQQEFSRVLLWYKNYLPIQSVLFHRSLFDELGGFDEALDLYEDWSLWVKYSTKCDFVLVPKVTSRYRVFTNRKGRTREFGKVYDRVAAAHTYPGFMVTPAEFRGMVKEYLRWRSLLCVTRENIRQVEAKVRNLLQGRTGD